MFLFQKLINQKISSKLLFYILAFSTIITLLTTAINIYTDYSIEIDLIDKRVENIQSSHLVSLSQSLWYMDADYAKAQLNGLLHLPDISTFGVGSA